MNNEPVAWMGKDYDGLKTDLYFDVERNKLPYRLYESAIPLYTHPQERPHNTVLVPCDKLAEMQAELAILRKAQEK